MRRLGMLSLPGRRTCHIASKLPSVTGDGDPIMVESPCLALGITHNIVNAFLHMTIFSLCYHQCSSLLHSCAIFHCLQLQLQRLLPCIGGLLSGCAVLSCMQLQLVLLCVAFCFRTSLQCSIAHAASLLVQRSVHCVVSALQRLIVFSCCAALYCSVANNAGLSDVMLFEHMDMLLALTTTQHHGTC